MKVELIKEIDKRGNIIYSVEIDRKYVEGSVIDGGNINEEIKGSYERAIELYQYVKDRKGEFLRQVLLSEEI